MPLLHLYNQVNQEHFNDMSVKDDNFHLWIKYKF